MAFGLQALTILAFLHPFGKSWDFSFSFFECCVALFEASAMHQDYVLLSSIRSDFYASTQRSSRSLLSGDSLP